METLDYNKSIIPEDMDRVLYRAVNMLYADLRNNPYGLAPIMQQELVDDYCSLIKVAKACFGMGLLSCTQTYRLISLDMLLKEQYPDMYKELYDE